MPADPPSSPALRASDANRDRVIELLRAAIADGRLDPAEFDERVDAALAARTIDALAPLTAHAVQFSDRLIDVTRICHGYSPIPRLARSLPGKPLPALRAVRVHEAL